MSQSSESTPSQGPLPVQPVDKPNICKPFEEPQEWIAAVNNWGQLGRWAFHVNRDPQMLARELKHRAATG